MAVITESVIIKAPVEKVFRYVTDPMTGPLYHPGVEEPKNVTSREAKVGQSWDWRATLIGVHVEGHAEVTDVEQNKRWVMSISGDAESQRVYRFESLDNQTKLTVEVERTVLKGPLAKLAQPVADGIHHINMRQALESLKKILESS